MTKKRFLIILSCFLVTLFLSVVFTRSLGHNENNDFESYTSELFRQEVSSSTISLHYTLKEPAAFGISDVPVSLGSLSTDTEAVCASAENALALLHSFNRGRLSAENQLTYDILEHYLDSGLKEAEYLLYEEPLAPLTGTQAQLPVILSEYKFYNTDDCDTYLELLTCIPDYFCSVIEFERAKSEAGLFMSDSNADTLINECKTFIQMGKSNYLYSSFEERLKELGLSENRQNKYICANSRYIETYVFPAYRELADVLSELRSTGKNNGGLCNLPGGKTYYELIVASRTGSPRTIPELRALTLSQMAEDTAAVQTVLAESYKDTDVSNAVSVDTNTPDTAGPDADGPDINIAVTTDSRQISLPASEPEKIIEELEGSIKNLFPAPPDVDTRIKYVQKSMEEYLSPAFYMIPAIDDTENNIIYINQGHMPDNLTLFTTLAHEGYPGHLYQTTYYASTEPDPLRNLLNFGGYTEGWATYSEMLSYYFTSLSRDQATLMQHNASIILGLYALADMGIHYDGWTLLDTVAFFRDYGIKDTDTIEEIYDLIVADPGNYLKYYIGYVEFLELKKEAIDAWGEEFSQERFHKAVLDAGPAPFDILRKYMLGTEYF